MRLLTRLLVSLAVFIPASGWLGRPVRGQAGAADRHRGLLRCLRAVQRGIKPR